MNGQRVSRKSFPCFASLDNRVETKVTISPLALSALPSWYRKCLPPNHHQRQKNDEGEEKRGSGCVLASVGPSSSLRRPCTEKPPPGQAFLIKRKEKQDQKESTSELDAEAAAIPHEARHALSW
jgi:hypothetical protein